MSHGRYSSDSHNPRTDIPEISRPSFRFPTFESQQKAALETIDWAEEQFVAWEEKRRHPPGRERHNHYDPRVRREHAAILFDIRRIHLRAVQLRSVYSQLVKSNELHRKWLHSFWGIGGSWQPGPPHGPDDIAWVLDEPFTTPEGIPDPRITIEEAREWLPSSYELSFAAQLELEISAGGLAPLTLEDELTAPYDAGNPDAGGFNANRKGAVADARKRVASYLDHYQRQRSKDGSLPDLYNERAWGHETRLKTLRLLVADGSKFIELTPEFDPDVLEYTTEQSIVGTRVSEITYFDPLMKYISNVSIANPADDTGDLTVTVTANDKVSKRTYTIRKATE